jgi:membrane protease YdiL (CAAX protease family)
VIPLFIIYELGIWLISSENLPVLRNSVDVLIRFTISKLGIIGIYSIAVVFLIGMIIAYMMNRKNFRRTKLKSSYFIMMTIESALWGLIISIVLSKVTVFLFKEGSNIVFQQIVLAIGSGLFEEFLFRVILVGILSIIFGLFLKNKFWYKISISIVIAAVIFSYFHFIGEFANDFELSIFLFRALAGIILGYLYVLRGFGIVAYAHSFYNLIVISQLPIN